MPRVLITAYGPYDGWKTNASWLVLQAITRDLPTNVELQTRLYPVDFAELPRRLEEDLSPGVDVALHMGQAPGKGRIALEAVGLNVARRREQRAEEANPLVEGAPLAYHSTLPLARWAQKLRGAGIPAEVSHHAGTFLCNGALYLTHHLAATHGWPTKATFLHVPLDPSQLIDSPSQQASLPAEVVAHGVRLMLEDLK